MYTILRTDTADVLIRNIILYIDENFGYAAAFERLDRMEESIKKLEEKPYLGEEPRYPALRRQGYRVLILEKDLVFYKIDEVQRVIVIHAVVDHRQDYLSIIRGL